MANNIIGGRRQVLFGKQNVSISLLGLTTSNTRIINRVGTTSPSFRPGRQLNALTDIEVGEGYVFYALQDMDLTEYFYTPAEVASGGGGSGNYILAQDGTPLQPQ